MAPLKDQFYDYTWDIRGLLGSVKTGETASDPAAKTTSYTYNNLGQRATETKGNQNKVIHSLVVSFKERTDGHVEPLTRSPPIGGAGPGVGQSALAEWFTRRHGRDDAGVTSEQSRRLPELVSRISGLDGIHARRHRGSFRRERGSAIASDGLYYWRVDATAYIRAYGISVPDDAIEHMRSRDWKPPEFSREQYLQIYQRLMELLEPDGGADR